MIQSVKLAKLRLSDLNVRTSTDLAIEPMAADIAARGVLQNLLVTPASKSRGHFEVFDGGRRLRALLLRVERGEIDPAHYDVPVKVLKGNNAALTETSLAANFHQLRLTPAEECRAFQHFLGKDGDIDAVAKRFGITRRFVEGRLRLASLAEPIFAALAAGDLSLDLAKAYAATDNRERQLMVFNAYGGHSYVTADTIRRAIASETMQATDPVALLVGEDAYVAAGGRIDRDLFGDFGDRWRDPDIAQRLAAETMEAEARRIGEQTGLGWIRPIARSDPWEAARELHPVALPQEPLTDEQNDRLSAIEARMDGLSEAMEDEALNEDAYAALETEHQALADERDALHHRPRVLPDDLKPLVGAFLVLNHKGQLALDTRYYSETPLRRPGDSDEGDNGRRNSPTPPPSPEGVAPGGKPLSARLADELAVQSRDVLAAALIAQPALALDYALFAMIDAQRQRYDDLGPSISARAPSDPVLGPLPTRATSHLGEVLDGLEAGWCEAQSAVERFDAFRALGDDAKAGWLAYIVAGSLTARSSNFRKGRSPLHNRLAELIELDPATWWRPTSENFFDRVSKGSLLALLTEVGGPVFAGRYANVKKGELSESCQKLFAGEAIVEADVKAKALAWLPRAMRFDAIDPAEPILEPEDEDREDTADDAPVDDGAVAGEAEEAASADVTEAA